jgi:hypothetical protein
MQGRRGHHRHQWGTGRGGGAGVQEEDGLEGLGWGSGRSDGHDLTAKSWQGGAEGGIPGR